MIATGLLLKYNQSELNQSPSSCVEVKKEWSFTSTPPIHVHDVDTEHFTFTLKPRVLIGPSQGQTGMDRTSMCVADVFGDIWSA